MSRLAGLPAIPDAVGAEQAFRAAELLYPGQITGLLYWGRERLARGDAQGALQIFRRAEKLAPRFADPAVWSGEALLALGDDKAEQAFHKAEPLAPRWGRLHLKWGEALAKLGKADEARAKWRAAATMDLSGRSVRGSRLCSRSRRPEPPLRVDSPR